MDKFKRRLASLIKDACAEGYVLQVDGRVLTVDSVYFHPTDNSDMYVCYCCHNLYKPNFRSQTIRHYVPLNWCPPCRQELVDNKGRADKVLVSKFEARTCKRLAKLAKLSATKLLKVVASWGEHKSRELTDACLRFNDTLLQLQLAEVKAVDNVEDKAASEEFRKQLAARLGKYV